MEAVAACPTPPQGHEALAAPMPSPWPQWMGRLWRRAVPAERPTDLDPTTGLLNADALYRKCRGTLRAGTAPVTVVLFELADLREVRDIYGQKVRRAVMELWVRRLRAAAGSRGLAARTGAEQFVLVLPGSDAAQAQAQLARSLGSPPRLEFDPRGLELVLVPEWVLDLAGDEEREVQPIHERLQAALTAQREAERRRQHYLELERARHSRPMPMRPLARRR